MPPIVKDSEIAVATPTSAAPATTVTKTRDESPARPQPVALEIPVTVSGARTVEGSDKREPFSENTKTVLVFVHGAVIRLASSLAPGQLVFLTNEKTKKEVVCQVVKSRNYRSVTGYVELEFTEPALGFWGMRFPSDRLAPAAPAAPAPSAAPATPRAAAPIVSAPLKAVPPPSSAPPVLPKPAAPVASVPPAASVPAPLKPAVVAPPPAAAVVEPAPAPPVAVAPIIPPPQPAVPISPAPVNNAAPPPPALPAMVESVIKSPVNLLTPSPDFAAAISSLFEPPAVPAAKPAPTEAPKSAVATTPAEPSSDQLKLQTARLQEQLSSLLFTETPAAPPPPPVSGATPKTGVPLPEVADKLLQLAQSDVKPAPPPEIKPAAPVRNLVPPSLAVEEVKIPSWLAPLARESECTTAGVAPELPPLPDSSTASLSSPSGALTETIPEPHRRSHSAVFGGQLLGESGAAIPAPASRAKKGLFIGIAATLTLAVGVVWYARQPGNLISSMLASRPAPAQAAKFAPANVPAPSAQPPAPVSASVVTPAPAPVRSSVSPSEPPSRAAATPALPVAPEAKNLSTAAHNTPPVELPKKPAIGEVHLAAPVVNRADDSQSGNDAAPTIDSNQPSNTDPVAGLAAGHRKEPTAPLPIGGDVKQARLLKSVPPVYPAAARTQHLSGAVKMDALIDVNGNVGSVTVISGPGLLHQAALEAVKQWKYEPAELDGKPTPVHLTVTVQFRGQ
jgi:protein TonB